MSKEFEQPRSFEERLEASQVHKVVNTEELLKDSQIPENLHRPFHELLLTKEDASTETQEEKLRLIDKTTKKITETYELSHFDITIVNILSDAVLGLWLEEKNKKN